MVICTHFQGICADLPHGELVEYTSVSSDFSCSQSPLILLDDIFISVTPK